MRHFRTHGLLYGIIFILSVLLFLKTQTHIVALRSLLIGAGLTVFAVVFLVVVINWLLNKVVENNNARVDALDLSRKLLLERVDIRGSFLLVAGLLGSVVSAYGWSQADIFHQYFTWPLVFLLSLSLAAIGSYECLRAARRSTLSGKRQVWLGRGEKAFLIFNSFLFIALSAMGYCFWNPDSATASGAVKIFLFFTVSSYLLVLIIGFYNCSRFWWTWIKTNRSAKCFLDREAIKG